MSAGCSHGYYDGLGGRQTSSLSCGHCCSCCCLYWCPATAQSYFPLCREWQELWRCARASQKAAFFHERPHNKGRIRTVTTCVVTALMAQTTPPAVNEPVVSSCAPPPPFPYLLSPSLPSPLSHVPLDLVGASHHPLYAPSWCHQSPPP